VCVCVCVADSDGSVCTPLRPSLVPDALQTRVRVLQREASGEACCKEGANVRVTVRIRVCVCVCVCENLCVCVSVCVGHENCLRGLHSVRLLLGEARGREFAAGKSLCACVCECLCVCVCRATAVTARMMTTMCSA